MSTADLFETESQQVPEAARPGNSSSPSPAGTPDIPVTYGPNGVSTGYFAKLQRMHYEAAERSAKAHQESLKKARAAAQEGIDRAVAHAERDVPGWSDVAFEFIRLHAMRNRGAKFTGYEIVQASKERVTPPPTDKAWGGPIQRAARAGVIVKVGTVPDPNPERHGSMVPLWQAA